MLGETYLATADYSKSSLFFDNAAEAGRFKFLPSVISLFGAGSALAGVMRNEKSLDLSAIRGYSAANKAKVFEGQVKRRIGEVLLNFDDSHAAEAEEWMRRAIEADQKNRTRFYLAQDHLAYAELLRRKGDLPRSRENLQKAASIFTECGADGWVPMAEKRLARL